MNERYYYNDDYFYQVEDIIDYATEDYNSVDELPEDFAIEYEDCELKPIYKLDAELLAKIIYGYFKNNNAAPKLWWGNGVKHIVTREEVVKFIKERDKE